MPDIPALIALPPAPITVSRHPDALAFWNETGRILIDWRILTELDLTMFEVLAVSHANVRRAERAAETVGLEEPLGRKLARLASRERLAFLKLAVCFGLSPMGRKKLGIEVQAAAPKPVRLMGRIARSRKTKGGTE